MLKRCKVLLLPTKDEATKLWLTDEDQLIYTGITDEYKEKYDGYHLYVVSDDVPVEGDWVLPDNPEYRHPWKFKPTPCPMPYWGNVKECKKIIATTDSSLTDDQYKFPKPSEGFVLKYVLEFQRGISLLNVMVNYTTVVDISNRETVARFEPYLDRHNAITIKKIKTSWNRVEVTELLTQVLNLGMKIRQDQLNGFGTNKSGNDHLADWIELNL